MHLNQFIPRVRYVGARRTPRTLRLAGGHRGLIPRVPARAEARGRAGVTGSGMTGRGGVADLSPRLE